MRCASRPILRELRAATASVPHSGMQIGADQGQFMALLVKLMGAKRCLEIGTYTGYSALAVALALPKDGSIVCCDVSEEWTAVGKPFWKKAGVAKKIDLQDRSRPRNPEKAEGAVRLRVHRRRQGNYLNYYERCLKLVRRGGLIAVDNVLWSGEVANEEAKDDAHGGAAQVQRPRAQGRARRAGDALDRRRGDAGAQALGLAEVVLVGVADRRGQACPTPASGSPRKARPSGSRRYTPRSVTT